MFLPCSPCCGSCSAESLRAFYDRMRSASVALSMTGNLPRQDAATQFSGGFGAIRVTPPSDIVQGEWSQWDEYQCPSALPLALVNGWFTENASPGEHSAFIQFRGFTSPDVPLDTSRLWAEANIYLMGLPSATDVQLYVPAGMPPAPYRTPWSLLPGTRSCWLWCSVRVKTRFGYYVDSRGRLPAVISNIGPSQSSNETIYAWDVGASTYSATVMQYGLRASVQSPRTGGQALSRGEGSAWWNYNRSLPVDEKTGFASAGRYATWDEGGTAYVDGVSTTQSQGMSVSLSHFRRDHFTAAGVEESWPFTWKPVSGVPEYTRWATNIRSPVLSGELEQLVTWQYDQAPQEYSRTDFGDTWLQSASLSFT